MAGILDSVDQRTQLVGENRLEILMFKLSRGQIFAINVFKIQEVQQMPKLTLIPDSHPAVVGVTHTRGREQFNTTRIQQDGLLPRHHHKLVGIDDVVRFIRVTTK